jgi:NAD+ synthase (glutamine-hydrolysing)
MRMVLSYLYAQLIPEKYKIPSYLLVLASGNIDEALVGYLTKYDCSSGDLNLIGSINKVDVQTKIEHLYNLYPKLTALEEILKAKPTAELTPLDESKPAQTDEDDIGLTY